MIQITILNEQELIEQENFDFAYLVNGTDKDEVENDFDMSDKQGRSLNFD